MGTASFALSDTNDKFSVASDGTISSRVVLDYDQLSNEERDKGFTLNIVVTDGSGAIFTRMVSVWVDMDRPPVFDHDTYVFKISENASVGDAAPPYGRSPSIFARDPNWDLVSFSGSSTEFRVDANGTIRVADPSGFDYESGLRFL